MAETNCNNESPITDMHKGRRIIALEAIFTAFDSLEESREKNQFTKRLQDMNELVRNVGGPRLFTDRSFEHINGFVRETLAMQEGLLPVLDTNRFYHEIIDTMNFSTFYDGGTNFKRVQGASLSYPRLFSGVTFKRRRQAAAPSSSADEQTLAAPSADEQDGQVGFERLQAVNSAWVPLDISGYLQYLGERRRPPAAAAPSANEQDVPQQDDVPVSDEEHALRLVERHDFEQRRNASWPYFAPIPGVYLPFGELSDDQKKILEQRQSAGYHDDYNDGYDSDSLPDLEPVN